MVENRKHCLYLKQASFEFSLFLISLCSALPKPMDIVENMEEYQNYWETIRFWNEELNYSWASNQQTNLGGDKSNSLEGTTSIKASKNVATEKNWRKNVVKERDRRKKFGDKLLALRAAVPKISKLDKASIIKDAIAYIQDLQEQERRLQAEIMELESKRLKKDLGYDFDQELPVLLRSKRTRYDQTYNHRVAASTCPIQVYGLRVTSMGEKALFVSLTCNETTDTMVRICEVFESLKLKIIKADLTTLPGMVKKTVLIEVDEEEKEHLKTKIERAISAMSM